MTEPKTSEPFKPTHRHRKGGLYEVLFEAVIVADLTPCIVYRGAKGVVWVRPESEFNDGRFEEIEEQST